MLVSLISKRVKAKREDLLDAATGKVRDHHRKLLALHLRLIDSLETEVTSTEKEIDQLLEPFRATIDRLQTIPGVGQLVAEVIVAEVGLDMKAFPTVGHFVSWAGLCPRNDESAGKRRSVAIKEGNTWLKPMLVQAAWGAARSKDTYLRSQFVRLKSRRGPKKAIVAVAASILTAVYFILRDNVDYREPGADYFDRIERQRIINKHVSGLRRLGLDVTLSEGEVEVA